MKRVTILSIPRLLSTLGATIGLLALDAASAQTAFTLGVCGLQGGRIYALTTDNSLYLYTAGDPTAGISTAGFTRLGRVTNISGNLIGIDARPSDGVANAIYGVTHTGNVYRISLNPLNLSTPTLVSTIAPRFAGGFQALADFNPTGAQNPLRLIGSNDENFALVNSAGTLDLTVPQTRIAYAPGDVNAGVDPNLTAGAYDNNIAGTTVTTFFAVDYNQNTLVTIADRTAAGSSNTAGGQLKSIGRLRQTDGTTTMPLVVGPNAGMDIASRPDSNGTVNSAFLVADHSLYCARFSGLGAISPGAAPLGSPLQDINFSRVFIPFSEPPIPARSPVVSGSFIDVAVIPPFQAAPAGYSISGRVIPQIPGSCAGRQILLSGPSGTLTTVTDASGNYAFTGLTNGAYTVSFSNPPMPVTVDGASVAGVNFTIIGCS